MRVIHYLFAMLRVCWFRFRGYETLVSVFEQDDRKRICYLCPQLQDDDCRVCGCPVEEKILLASESCPLKKWGKVRRSV